MRLFHTCGESLIFNHDVTLKLSSYFSYNNGIINLNKHVIKTTTGTNPIIIVDNKTIFHCTHCGTDVLMKDSLGQCDDCKVLVVMSDIEKIGESITMCKKCAKRQKQFMEFLIFNQDKRIESESEVNENSERNSRRTRNTLDFSPVNTSPEPTDVLNDLPIEAEESEPDLEEEDYDEPEEN